SKIFWLYNLFAFFATAGFCSFILVAYHFKLTGFLTDAQIPLFYALAMGVDAVAALAIGKAYDILKDKSGNLNSGLNLLVLVPLISILMLFFIFSSSILFIIIGLILWGIVMGIQETIMRSAIADTTSLKKRGTGYGIFNTTYGIAIFLGSFLFGLLYDRGLYLVFIGAFILEAAALAVFIFMRKEILTK
ncbi:MAG: MFS transporter, partial [Candidatus Omnitrophica bacterium]|nr:MFS transporter [Candidatus Omnitrophota bacterium]